MMKASPSALFAALTLAASTSQALGADADMTRAIERDLGMSAAQLEDYKKVEQRAQHGRGSAMNAFGAAFAGSWLERSNGSYLWVTGAVGIAPDDPRTRKVKADKHVVVQHTLQELEQAIAALDANSGWLPAGSGVHWWGTSERKNRVIISARPQSTGLARQFAMASGVSESMIELDLSDLVPGGAARGGDSIGGCSLGFNATRNGLRGFVTAGHCGLPGFILSHAEANAGASITLSSYSSLNPNVSNGSDHAWAQIASSAWTSPPLVNRYVAGSSMSVVGNLEVPEGGALCKSGRITGFQCGTLMYRNVTVTYFEGETLRGLSMTDACITRGDSGGAIISSNGEAQGMTSGGRYLSPTVSSNCGYAGLGTALTYFQRLQPAIDQYQLILTTVSTCGRLNPTQLLQTGQTLWSCNGQFRLDMQYDGNLVFRRPNGSVVWASNRFGSNSTLTVQRDGNLVTRNGIGGATWAAGTLGSGNTLFLTDAGEFKVVNLYGMALWYVCDEWTPGSACYSTPGGGA